MRTAFDLLGLLLVAAGESLGGFLLPPTWRIGSFGVLFVAGVLLIVIRHVVWPRPNLAALLVRWMAGESRDRGWVASVAILTRLLVLCAGLTAVFVTGLKLKEEHPRIARSPVLNLPARYDAGWYLRIARHGYRYRPDLGDWQHPIAFFPGYPAAMRLAGDLVTVPVRVFGTPEFLENGNTRVLWGGVLVSWLCTLAACIRIGALAAMEIPRSTAAKWAAGLTMAWPFALFFSTAYSEGMFLLALAGALLAWRRERWAAAAAWGLLCGLTRSNGWALSIALAVDLAARRRLPPPRAAAAALAPAAGAALFSTYVYSATGSFTAWISAQQAWGREVEPFSFVVRRWHAVATEGLWPYITRDPSDALTFVCVTMVFAASAVLLYRRQWLYGTLIVAYMTPALLIDLPAAGRMTSVLFPMWFACVGSWRPAALWGVAVSGFAMQLLLAAYHFTWRPPF